MEHGTIKVTASQPARTEDCRLKGIRNRNEISTHFVFVWPSRTSTCDSKTNNMEKKRDYLLLKSLSVSLKKERISMTFGAVFERELESSAVERNFRGRLVDLASRLGESTWRVDLASRLGESGKPTLGRPLARRFVSEAATRRPRGRVCYSLTRPVLTHTHTNTLVLSVSFLLGCTVSSEFASAGLCVRVCQCLSLPVCACVSACVCVCVSRRGFGFRAGHPGPRWPCNQSRISLPTSPRITPRRPTTTTTSSSSSSSSSSTSSSSSSTNRFGWSLICIDCDGDLHDVPGLVFVRRGVGRFVAVSAWSSRARRRPRSGRRICIRRGRPKLFACGRVAGRCSRFGAIARHFLSSDGPMAPFCAPPLPPPPPSPTRFYRNAVDTSFLRLVT